MTNELKELKGLKDLRVASPCRADWNKMTGDERTRFCGECKLHVHDLSAMTTDQAQALLRSAGNGRLCVRFFRRADGRVLTRDCPVGLRQKLRTAWGRAMALAAALCASLAAACGGAPRDGSGQGGQVTAPPAVEPRPRGFERGEAVMGDIAVPMPVPERGAEMGIAAPRDR